MASTMPRIPHSRVSFPLCAFLPVSADGSNPYGKQEGGIGLRCAVGMLAKERAFLFRPGLSRFLIPINPHSPPLPIPWKWETKGMRFPFKRTRSKEEALGEFGITRGIWGGVFPKSGAVGGWARAFFGIRRECAEGWL